MTLGAADDPAVLDHQAAAQVDLSDAALGAQTLKGRVAGLCDHVARGEDVAGLGIVDHDVRVGARGDDALAAIEVKSGRVSKSGMTEFLAQNPQAKPMIVGDRNVSVEQFLRDEVELF